MSKIKNAFHDEFEARRAAEDGMVEDEGRAVLPHVSGGGQIVPTGTELRMQLMEEQNQRRLRVEAPAIEAIAQIIEREFRDVVNARREAVRAATAIVRMLDGVLPGTETERENSGKTGSGNGANA